MTDPVDATGVVGKATFTTHVYVGDPLVRVQTPDAIHVTVDTARLPGERANLEQSGNAERCDNYSGQTEFGVWLASIRSTRRRWWPLGAPWANGWRHATRLRV